MSILMTTNRQALLKSRPHGLVTQDNFEFFDTPIVEPGDGEFRVKIEAVSIDPAMRGWMADGKSYIPPVGIGEVMRAGAAGRSEIFRASCTVDGRYGGSAALCP